MGGDCCGPKVEGETIAFRNPFLIREHELLDAPEQLFLVKGRELEASARVPESIHVLHRAEETDVAVLIAVGFHSFEAFQGVVEHAGRGVHLEISHRRDFGRGPACLSVPVDLEHVIAERGTKCKLIIFNFSTRRRVWLHYELGCLRACQ